MQGPVIVAPRTVSAPSRAFAAGYRPWYEIAALLEVVVEAWEWREASWHHWAVPIVQQKADLGGARSFDPGRRSAITGLPGGEHAPSPPLDTSLAEMLTVSLLGRISRTVYRQPQLGLVSELGEQEGAFFRRCLSIFGPALRAGDMRGEQGAAAMATVRAAIEVRQLGPGELLTPALRVGVGWYPTGIEPTTAPADLLVKGTIRGGAG